MRNVLAKFTISAYIEPMKLGSHIRSLSIAIASAGCFIAAPVFAQTASPVSAKVHISGSCEKCDLSNRNLPGLSFRGSNFAGTNFTNTNLSGAKLDGANLSSAQFNKAYLMRAQGTGVQMPNSSLRNATLTEATLISSNFSGADLRRADLTRSDFTGSNFSGAIFKGTDAMGCQFSKTSFANAKLDHANFTDANFSGANMRNAKFGDAIVSNSRFVGADLSGANLSKVQGLTPEQIATACGDDKTRLANNLIITACPETNAMKSLGMASLQSDVAAPMAEVETAPKPPRHTMFFRELQNSRRLAPAPNRNLTERELAVLELDKAIAALDETMPNLPLDSPARQQLMKSREHMLNVREEKRD